MFANDANLFSPHGNIKDLFNNVNLELNKIAVWFKANKLSLNEGKTKYTFFHKFRQKDNIPLKLLMLVINGKVIERTTSIKFLGILFDEHLSKKAEMLQKSNFDYVLYLCYINFYFDYIFHIYVMCSAIYLLYFYMYIICFLIFLYISISILFDFKFV